MKAEIHEVLCGRCIAIFDLKSTKITVGRNQNADICSISKWASRDHAFIEALGRRWFVTDNNSSNGVYVDGQKIEPCVPLHLKNGMEMSLGPTDLTVGRYQFWFSRTYTNPPPKPEPSVRSRNKAPTQCTGIGCKRRVEEVVVQRTSRDSSPDEILLPLRQRLALNMAAERGISPYEIDFNNSQIKFDSDRENDSRTWEAPSTSQSESTPQRKAAKRPRKMLIKPFSSDSEDSSPEPPAQDPMITITKQRFEELTDIEEQYRNEVINREKIIARTYAEELDRNFTCPICAVIFIKATTLGCGHTFCFRCLETWKRQTVRCPMCRGVIGFECRNMVLDDYIESMVNKAGTECIEQRKKSIIDHEAIGAAVAETENNDEILIFDDDVLLDELTGDELFEAQLIQIIDD